MPSHGGCSTKPGIVHAPHGLPCVGAPHASPASAHHRHSSGSDATDIVSPSGGRCEGGRAGAGRRGDGAKAGADRGAAGWAAPHGALVAGQTGKGRPGGSWTSSQGKSQGWDAGNWVVFERGVRGRGAEAGYRWLLDRQDGRGQRARASARAHSKTCPVALALSLSSSPASPFPGYPRSRTHALSLPSRHCHPGRHHARHHPPGGPRAGAARARPPPCPPPRRHRLAQWPVLLSPRPGRRRIRQAGGRRRVGRGRGGV